MPIKKSPTALLADLDRQVKEIQEDSPDVAIVPPVSVKKSVSPPVPEKVSIPLEESVEPPEPDEAALRAQEQAHKEALLLGRQEPPEVVEDVPAPDAETVLFHVREDGFTAWGQIYYRGQELEVIHGSRAWRATCDRNGDSWVALVDNSVEQTKRWGKVMLAPGPWTGAAWPEGPAADAEARRGRKPPTRFML